MSTTARACLALASLAFVAACDTELGPSGSLRPGVQIEDPGQICTPLNKNGVASFSWETVENDSDVAVEVVRVELDGVAAKRGGDVEELVVDDWFLTGEEWMGGSVGRGPLADPGSERLPTTVEPGEAPMLSFAVRAPGGLRVPHTFKPRVVYASGGRGREASVVLQWEVKVAPAGTTCR